jgi:uncharacterized protein
MKIFFDTSSFVKLYINESGSSKVSEFYKNADVVALSAICFPEIISTLNRLLREKSISSEEYQKIKNIVLADMKVVKICEITPEIIQRTIKCLESNRLRAMDAIHLACAISIIPDLFISSDKRQVTAARQEGLNIIEI